MGGFKSGAADDDWGDEEAVDDAESTDEDNTEDTQKHASEPTQEATRSSTWESPTPRLPWIHRRSSITDGREKTVQLHLQDSTVDAERSGKTDVEQLLGESVKKADLREAALLVGLEHADEVAEVLREWGYAIE